MTTIRGIEERQLISRLSKGDRSAFELLFRHYYPGLVIYSSKFTQDRDEAEEIVQEYFIRLWERRRALKASTSLKSYLFQSVKNRSLNFLRDRQVSYPIVEELIEQSNSHLIFNEDLYVASELQQRIEQAVSNLPDKCGQVFQMSRFRNMTNDEIASELGLSKRTVETHISHALKALRMELKDYLSLLILLNII